MKKWWPLKHTQCLLSGRLDYNLDSLDFKILDALKKDARTPFVALAKELNVTPGIVQARYYKMKKAGLIKGTTLILDMSKMVKRYMGSIGIDAIESELKDVIKYINSLQVDEAQIVTWSTFGRYNIASIVFTKTRWTFSGLGN